MGALTDFQDDNANRHQSVSGVVLVLSNSNVKGKCVGVRGATACEVSSSSMTAKDGMQVFRIVNLHVSTIKLQSKEGQDQGRHYQEIEPAIGYVSLVRRAWEGRGTLANRSFMREEENREGGCKCGTCLRTRLLSSSGVQSTCVPAASATSLLTLVVWLGALPTSRSFSVFSDMVTLLEGISTLVGKECGAQNTCHVYCDVSKGRRMNYMSKQWERRKGGISCIEQPSDL